MHTLKLFYLLVLIIQFTSVSGARWFNFKKDDKDEDCEPEIVAIRKTKVLPIAVPVYQRKRTYSVKTRKSRRKNEDEEETDYKKSTNETEDDEKNEDEKSDAQHESKGVKTNLVNDRVTSSSERNVQRIDKNIDYKSNEDLSERSDNTNEKLKNNQIEIDDQDDLIDNNEDTLHDSLDYETDDLIKNAIDDDDEDVEEFMASNDDL